MNITITHKNRYFPDLQSEDGGGNRSADRQSLFGLSGFFNSLVRKQIEVH